jgi:hypothetical protein
MDVGTILMEKLQALGADGLCHLDAEGCGCGLDDFMPCRSPWPDCVPAKKTIEVDEDGESFEYFRPTEFQFGADVPGGAQGGKQPAGGRDGSN